MGIDAEMFIRTKQVITDNILREAEYKLFSYFGPEKLDSYNDKLLEVVSIWKQDGPDIAPRKGETFIRVYLWTRYYGPGYERGDILFILNLAEVLEYIFPGSEIWYGGDSSGVLAEKLGREERTELKQHWLMNNPSPYFRSINPFMNKGTFDDNPICNRCKIPMHRYGFGGGNDRKSPAFYGSWSCECGEKFVIRNNKETRTTYRERKQRESDLRNKAINLLSVEEINEFREYR